MERSESIQNLAVAMTSFQSEMGSVVRDGVNPFFHSKYATLENILASIKPLMGKVGLSFSQFPSGENELTTILMHASGEFITATCKIQLKDQTAQAQGSAISYMRRYALSAVLGLATEEDDDGQQASVLKKSIKPAAVRHVPLQQPVKAQTPTSAVPVAPQAKEASSYPDLCSVENCIEEINEAIKNFSLRKYGKVLCMRHQREASKK